MHTRAETVHLSPNSLSGGMHTQKQAIDGWKQITYLQCVNQHQLTLDAAFLAIGG
jgi:hypothetical protein